MSNICHDIEPLMDNFFEGCLDRKERSRFYSHLKTCRICRTAFEKEKEIVRQLRSLPVYECPDFIESIIKASTIHRTETLSPKEKRSINWSFIWKPVTAGVLAVAVILVFVFKPDASVQEPVPVEYTQEEIEKAREQAKYSLALVANTLKQEQEQAVKDVVFKDVSQTIKRSIGIALPILGGDKK